MDADPLPAHLAPGSIVAGRYRVLRQLGSGGIGIVLEAEQLGLGQRVALKLLRNELLDDPDTLARFEREARVVSQLSSENIVRIFGVERSEHGEPIMVLEFLFGHPVDALIDDPNPISISAAVDIVAEACAGLAVAHAAGVVHRDVKPGNLFLAVRADRSQVVKVLDFGLTTELGSKDARLTSTRRSFGTPLYMSPEQIMSAKDVDPRTDQHALALSLFELLTKRPAFWDTLPSALTVKIVTTPPPSARGYRPEIPEGLDEAILRALAKQPQGRFATIADFAAAIAPFGTKRAHDAALRARTVLSLGLPIDTGVRAAGSGPTTQAEWTTKRMVPAGGPASRTLLSLAAAAGLGVVGFAAVLAIVAARNRSVEPDTAPRSASAPAATSPPRASSTVTLATSLAAPPPTVAPTPPALPTGSTVASDAASGGRSRPPSRPTTSKKPEFIPDY